MSRDTDQSAELQSLLRIELSLLLHTPQQRLAMFFSRPDITPRLPLPVSDVDPYLIRRSESASNGISIGSAVFAQLTRVPIFYYG